MGGLCAVASTPGADSPGVWGRRYERLCTNACAGHTRASARTCAHPDEQASTHAHARAHTCPDAAAGPVDRSDYLKGTHGHEFLRKRSEGKIAPTTQ